MRTARRTITLPDEIDQAAHGAGVDISAVARRAICDELVRHQRTAALDAWLDALDEQGVPSGGALERAQAWGAGARTVMNS